MIDPPGSVMLNAASLIPDNPLGLPPTTRVPSRDIAHGSLLKLAPPRLPVVIRLVWALAAVPTNTSAIAPATV